ncbi:MAG: GGDEF domain-containing protein [Stellaceae bacterium]
MHNLTLKIIQRQILEPDNARPRSKQSFVANFRARRRPKIQTDALPCLDVERRQTSISAIMIDLDHFKRVNDQHGHAAGDAVLRDAAAAILSCLRSVDVVCRYGGEELAVLLSDCSLAAATGKAEQIRARISEFTSARGVTVTASLGVSSIPETSNEVADLLPAADAALYQAKQQGRDRVVAAPIQRSAKRLSLINAEAATPAEEARGT